MGSFTHFYYGSNSEILNKLSSSGPYKLYRKILILIRAADIFFEILELVPKCLKESPWVPQVLSEALILGTKAPPTIF